MTIATLLFALIATPSAEGTGEPILLDFQATWCGPCRQMRPEIDALIQKGYPIKEIDIDRSPDLAARYQVSQGTVRKAIDGLEATASNAIVFHAGTKRDGDRFVTAGGRVFGITALADDLASARARAYDAVGRIHFDGAHYRRDIAVKGLSA